MAQESSNGKITIEQTPFIIPDLTVKDLLSAIPAHCYKRSLFRSSTYVICDFFLWAGIYKAGAYADSLITPATVPNPYLHAFARFAVWALYGFAAGLVGTGLWVLAHECGHQAFSESKTVNNVVGWVLHSALGVPYHSWRITHAKHHASTGHMTQDQVYVPKTRSQLGLPEFKPDQEDLQGSTVTEEVMNELWDAIGDTPLGASFGVFTYLFAGFPMYLINNASGQKRYPKNTSHFKPEAVMFAPHQRNQILVSDIGIMIWLGAIVWSSYQFGFVNVLRLYLVPYLWVNHWLVLITFLQHTDPLLPHYRASEFTFPRGALATFDRNTMGELGSIGAWFGALLTHGIAETHVAHHVCSKIPHYNAWEATYALRSKLEQSGIKLEGRAVGWGEMYRVFRECKFVEDDGDIVFYKNAKGLAATRPVFVDNTASDSGIEIMDKDA